MRLFLSTLFALGLATTLVAQQNSATNSQQPAPDSATGQTTSQPETSPAAPPPDKVIRDWHPLVIQKGTMAVPVAIGTPTQQATTTTAPTTVSAPQPQVTAPTPTPAPQATSQPAFRQQPVVIKKTDLAVPVAVGVPAQPQSSSSSNTDSQQQPSSTQASPQQPPELGGAPPPAPIGTPLLPTVSKKEAEEAKRQFQAGVKLKEKGDVEAAYTKFSSAAQLDPMKLDYITAREFTRQLLAYQAIQRGNTAMLENNEIVAMAEFRRALEYDATNSFALQRLRDAMPAEQVTDKPVRVVEQSVPIQLRPKPEPHDFKFRGDMRSLLSQVASAYGIKAGFDDSVQSKRVFFNIDNVNFATALKAACSVTKTFWVPLTPTQIYFLADTVENRRNFEHLALRTFYLPDLNDQQITEMTNSLRVLLNLRFIAIDKGANTISIRAEIPLLEAADQLIRSLSGGRPEVLLDVNVFAVGTSLARSLGTALPTQFTMFNISPALLAGLGQNAQNLVNQLIASGGINAANSSAVQALLAQLANSTSGSILSQPFVTIGGGLTLFGLTGGGTGISPTFSLNTSEIKSLEHLMLRASHNNPAIAKIGERYPIINATYAPIYNTASIASVIGNGTYIAPFPSFNFEDLGFNLKATPTIHGDSDISMKLELQLRSLGTQSVNGIPIINNREYTGEISVKDGETSVVTGIIDMNDSRSISGYPFLGQVPGLGYSASVHNKNVTEDELLIVITPHILRLADQTPFALELPPAH